MDIREQEQKLIEVKITNCLIYWEEVDHNEGRPDKLRQLIRAKTLLNLVKEAGWIDPESCEKCSDDYTLTANALQAILKQEQEKSKEAGYVKPPESMEITELAEILFNLPGTIANIKANIQSFLLANHCVKLAKDQMLPTIEFAEIKGTVVSLSNDDFAKLLTIMDIWRRRILKANWRKIEVSND